jgi:hypothetical protein
MARGFPRQLAQGVEPEVAEQVVGQLEKTLRTA